MTRGAYQLLGFGLAGAVIASAFQVILTALIDADPLGLLATAVIGAAAGFVLGILIAAERKDGDIDRKLTEQQGAGLQRADVTEEGELARGQRRHATVDDRG